MRITCVYFCIILGTASMLLADPSHGQGLEEKISIGMNHEPLKALTAKIQQATSFTFGYRTGLLDSYPDVSFSEGIRTVQETLDLAFTNTPLRYRLMGKVIMIFDRNEQPSPENVTSPDEANPNRLITVSGTVKDEQGDPLAGVNIVVKGTAFGTTTDANGNFKLDVSEDAETFIFSFIGYQTIEMKLENKTQFDIVMQPDVTTLSAVEVVSGGYYEITNRMKTGSIARVNGSDIETQPVTSPLLSIQGRVPGVEISPTSGTPGAAVKIQIRGQNSLRNGLGGDVVDGNLPLYVIDGIPVSSTPISSGSVSLLRSGIDPLSTINPANIESIQILKDADATAIYGSRGANGVILITTKKANQGSGISLDFGIYRGFGKVVNRVDMLNTTEYLEMRHEAIRNDGGNALNNYKSPTNGPRIYPDLLFWDTTRYTNWQDVLVGDQSNITDANLNMAGGSGQTTFRLGGAFHKETLLYPGDFGYNRYSGTFNIDHHSKDNSIRLAFSGNYGLDEHKIFDSNLLMNNALTLPPDAPELHRSDGTLNWANRPTGSTWSNPMSWLRQPHSSSAHNLITRLDVTYQLTKSINVKVGSGFSRYSQDETINTTIASLDPFGFDPKEGSSQVNSDLRTSWIVEPQISYSTNINSHNFNGLAGATFQQTNSESLNLFGTGFTSDAMLGAFRGARTLSSSNSNTQYRYGAIFARIGYDFRSKYLINVTARRDGSSRFGPDNRFGNFWAIGAAWVFSNENFFEGKIPFVSFGKIRGSYGTTGNDQIGDSQYIKTYIVPTSTYEGNPGLVPSALFNSDYAWEVTKKAEGAIELAFLDSRISVEVAYYRNRSSNQLVQYQLPGTAGFGSVLKNFDATVENKGWEFSLNTVNIKANSFRWTTSINLSLTRNRLVNFPNIESSPYSTRFKVGEPLSIQWAYLNTGVDPTTGLYTFKDVTGDGNINSADQDFTKALATKYYGGISSGIVFKGIELNVHFQFSDRTARTDYFGAPGTRSNQPKSVLDRWQQEGDVTDVQRYTTTGAGLTAYNRWRGSDATLETVRFFRLKTLNITYNLPSAIVNKARLQAAKVFIQGQNLFTLSNFNGWDPETLYGVPPLRIISAGFQIKL